MVIFARIPAVQHRIAARGRLNKRARISGSFGKNQFG